MSDRAQMEKTLLEAYAARKRGDLDELCRIFSQHARFEMAGSNASPIARKVIGAGEFRELMAGMIKTFVILDYTIVAMLIERSAAAVHWRAKIRSSVTDQTVETDFFDLIHIENGQIVSFIEFCDTALAARMMQG